MTNITKNNWTFVLIMIIGSIFGTLIGEYLGGFLPFLGFGQSVGLDPAIIDLAVIQITFGLKLYLNIATILGLFTAIFIYSRL